MTSSRHTAVVFDAFGTLIKPVERSVSVYSRLPASVGLARMPDRDSIARLSLYDDVAATLRALRSAGLKLGVCRNLGLDRPRFNFKVDVSRAARKT